MVFSKFEAKPWMQLIFSDVHRVKSVQIRMFFWSLFSCIQSEYRKIRIRKNSLFGHFSRSGCRYQQTKNIGKNEAVTHRCSVKKGAVRDFANFPENNCARVSFLIKLQAGPAILLKKRLQQRCFSVKNTFFYRTPPVAGSVRKKNAAKACFVTE